jgi:hypothetical protein
MPLLASGSSEITTTAIGAGVGLRATKKQSLCRHGGMGQRQVTTPNPVGIGGMGAGFVQLTPLEDERSG